MAKKHRRSGPTEGWNNRFSWQPGPQRGRDWFGDRMPIDDTTSRGGRRC